MVIKLEIKRRGERSLIVNYSSKRFNDIELPVFDDVF